MKLVISYNANTVRNLISANEKPDATLNQASQKRFKKIKLRESD